VGKGERSKRGQEVDRQRVTNQSGCSKGGGMVCGGAGLARE